MHFSTSSLIVITVALVCQLSNAHKKPDEKHTKVVFSCHMNPDPNVPGQYIQAVCGRATELLHPEDPTSTPTKFAFVAANSVTGSIVDYNCIDTKMDNNYCCLANTFPFDNHEIDTDANTVTKNCKVIPGNK
ncbi:hypothetical protein PtA15_17A268 [Puccinia triticina]|uniref:Hydrophobin n=1 Tax=Puccinia triticina TaxID=208348 RepID=A0ABY7D8X6_9BASI|nr:uncharacterized protein PtA15_17A268 [Puccinia triticina]WAQ92786.1 hypothetical protein PtA15_17A268 [Puccinia triticina]WAR63686.1 hypothetical protein PtB15_17B287 [Puccinia triticina]